MPVRALTVTALVMAAGALSACGGTSEPDAPPGSAGNPLVAEIPEQTGSGRHNEGSGPSSEEPGYQTLVDRQTSNPDDRFTPCNLVTPRQARSILGSPIAEPVEAPQGPTCIYRSASGGSFVTLAVQDRTLEDLRKQMRRPEPVDVSNRRAYCGTHGQPTLYVSLGRKGVLSVAAPCSIARQFAAKAVARETG
jgi:Protein of unknown function (DUF3558)